MVSIRKRRHSALLLDRHASKVVSQKEIVEHRNLKIESSVPPQQAACTFNVDTKIKPVFEGVTGISAGSSSSKDESRSSVQECDAKRRKWQRRKLLENQEPCVMRGVYFKNMKWQAAIKVEKKQIHLGTVSSMEEAAHLYDRAAYMCGREPNFDLPEEEKCMLQGLQWEEFLALTRNEIANKKRQKRLEAGMRRKQAADLVLSLP